MCIVLYDYDEIKKESILVKRESDCENCQIRLNKRGCDGTQEYKDSHSEQMTIFDFMKGE